MRNNRLLWTFVLLLGIIALTASAFEQAKPAAALYPREDKTMTTATETAKESAKGTPTDTAKESATPTATDTGSGKKSTATDTAGSDSKSGDKSTGTKTTGTSTRTRTTKPNINDPVGGVQMKTPSIMDPMSFYPIGGEPITWIYNYTSLVVTPTAVNIQAFCSSTQQYYTIANNYSIASTSVVWDLKAYEQTGQPPLVQETYTLYIWDAGSDKTAVPTAGHLQVYKGLQFAMYTKRPYVPKESYVCGTCNSAISLLNSHEIKVLLGSALMAALSFTWFLHGIF